MVHQIVLITQIHTTKHRPLTMISAMLAQCEKSSARYNLFICTLQRVKVNKYGITSSLKILPKSTLGQFRKVGRTFRTL